MPLIAQLRSTGERVDITQFTNPRTDLQADDVVCQVCQAPMMIKAGRIMRPHFAHRTPCTSTYASHPESYEHLWLKWAIAEKVKAEWQEYGTAHIAFEYPVPEVMRIIDVAMLFPNGWIVAHEIQLARLTTEELEQRTKDYLHAGIDVIWWLGGGAATPANRQWCVDRFGVCFVLDLRAVPARNSEPFIERASAGAS